MSQRSIPSTLTTTPLQDLADGWKTMMDDKTRLSGQVTTDGQVQPEFRNHIIKDSIQSHYLQEASDKWLNTPKF